MNQVKSIEVVHVHTLKQTPYTKLKSFKNRERILRSLSAFLKRSVKRKCIAFRTPKLSISISQKITCTYCVRFYIFIALSVTHAYFTYLTQ